MLNTDKNRPTLSSALLISNRLFY